MKLITRIKNSGLKMTFIAAKSGVGYTHLTKVLNEELPICKKTREKLELFVRDFMVSDEELPHDENNDFFESSITIYALVDPRNDKVRYVGRTSLRLNDRLKMHLSEKKITSKKHWILELKKLGLKPKIKRLEVINKEIIDGFEKKWVDFYEKKGDNLLNINLM